MQGLPPSHRNCLSVNIYAEIHLTEMKVRYLGVPAACTSFLPAISRYRIEIRHGGRTGILFFFVGGVGSMIVCVGSESNACDTCMLRHVLRIIAYLRNPQATEVQSELRGTGKGNTSVDGV